jgi:hypothetical protein
VSRALLSIFDALYTNKVGARYPVNGGKDGKLLKDLRAIYSDEDIARYMQAFFDIEDPFIEQSGYSIGCFRGCLPKVIAWANRKPRMVERPVWSCPHLEQCGNPGACANADILGRARKAS